jgi:ubiquinone/menaquinone biosynthesis C-methylase UbiE
LRWIVRDLALLALNFLQSILVSLARLLGIIRFPVPPNSLMRKTSSRNIFHYYRSGLTTYLPIVTLARLYGVKMDETTNVLDFGCGVGRQLLHIVSDYPKAHYYACDVDETEVKFIQKNYPSVEAYTNDFNPPLQYENESMDLIYSISTFSHFDQTSQELWLRELWRVAKHGALCLLTTEGWRAFNMLRSAFVDEVDPAEHLKTTGILYKEYFHLISGQRHKHISPKLNSYRGIGGSYGNTVMTPKFINENWQKSGFEVLGISEGVIDSRQDVVVLRRP